ncbi:MAG: hypothetical protein Q8O82_10245 [Pseudorhodobacter sp.]|nr:hypothetical protein [Pseudorhodobacter sp.]
MGLLSYIVAGFDPTGCDVVFVPVAIAYDRVLEDRLLVEAGRTGVRKFRAGKLAIAGFIARNGWRMIRGQFAGFGSAAVAFGAPVSLRDYLARPGASTEGLGAVLMAEVAQSLPVLPVPLVAAVVAGGPVLRSDIGLRLAELVKRLESLGAVLKLPPGGVQAALDDGLRTLTARGILRDGPLGLEPDPASAALLAFYAAPVLQRLEAGAETTPMLVPEIAAGV